MKCRIIQGLCWWGEGLSASLDRMSLRGSLVGNGSAFLLHEKGSASKMSLVTLLLSLKSWEAWFRGISKLISFLISRLSHKQSLSSVFLQTENWNGKYRFCGCFYEKSTFKVFSSTEVIHSCTNCEDKTLHLCSEGATRLYMFFVTFHCPMKVPVQLYWAPTQVIYDGFSHSVRPCAGSECLSWSPSSDSIM